MKEAIKQYEKWLYSSKVDNETKEALNKIKGNEEEIALRFSSPMVGAANSTTW